MLTGIKVHILKQVHEVAGPSPVGAFVIAGNEVKYASIDSADKGAGRMGDDGTPAWTRFG